MPHGAGPGSSYKNSLAWCSLRSWRDSGAWGTFLVEPPHEARLLYIMIMFLLPY